jgi:hypothetical protein
MFRNNKMYVVGMMAAALLLLTACGNDEPAPEPEPTPAAVQAEGEAQAEPTTTEEAAPVVEATEEGAPAAEATEEEAAEEPGEDAVAGGGANLNIVSARPVTEIVGAREAPLAAVSPDGAHLAWIQRSGSGRQSVGQFCLFTFANAGRQCFDAPEAFQSFPYQLFWSPDSGAIAFTENPIQLGLESDVWVFSVTDGSFANRTDDGVTGIWRTGADPFALDISPMWSPDGSEIYFWRVEPLGNLEYNLGIYRVGIAEGEAETVADLSASLAGFLPMLQQEFLTMDGMSALSPDGTQVAALLTDATADPFGATTRSLWLIPMGESGAEPQQLMSGVDFQAALPAWQTLPAGPQGLSWMADGVGLVVNAFANDTHAPLNVYYHVDTATGDATPVVDFSRAESLNALFEAGEGEIPLRYYAPWSASLSPDNMSLIMYNDLGGTAGVLQAALPPTGELPTLLGAAESPALLNNGTRTSRAVDGKVIMSNNMFSFE